MHIIQLVYGRLQQYYMMDIGAKQPIESVDEFMIVKTIGSGYTAEVKLALDPYGRPVAIKQFKQEPSAMKSLKAELQVMGELSHQNLLQLVAVRETAMVRKEGEPERACCAIVLEYAAGGELFDFVAQTGHFAERMARTLFQQLMAGLHYMHERGYAHRDIKAENLLLTSAYKLKLADFGFACLLQGRSGSGALRTWLGTRGYMAPEIENRQHYDGRRTDIFAAGVVLFIMYAGCPPFESSSVTDPFYRLIREKRFTIFWKAHSRRRPPDFFSDPFKDLIQSLLAFDPNERPTAFQVSQHPWVNGPQYTPEQMTAEFIQRKEKLQEILAKRKREVQEERQCRIQLIRDQGQTTRGSEGWREAEFIWEYQRQAVRGLELRPLPRCSPSDLVVDSVDCAITFTQLKCFMRGHCVSLESEQQEQDQLSPFHPRELRCVEVTDIDHKIKATYEYEIVIDEESLPSKLTFQVEMGLGSLSKPALHFSLLQGSEFLLRVVMGGIRLSLFP